MSGEIKPTLSTMLGERSFKDYKKCNDYYYYKKKRWKMLKKKELTLFLLFKVIQLSLRLNISIS